MEDLVRGWLNETGSLWRIWSEGGSTNLDPYGGAWRLQVLLRLGHQDGLVTGQHRAVAVRGGVPLAGHGARCLHGYAHGLGAVQAVGGVVQGRGRAEAQAQAQAQAQARAVGGPHAAPRVPPLMVGVLGGLCAALGRDGDEGLGGGAGRDGGRGLLVAGGVADGWKARIAA